MTLELSENALYFLYKLKRERLDSYYCTLGIGDCSKGYYYKCEFLKNGDVKVYSTSYKGEIIQKEMFDVCFTKHNKIQKFFYKFLDCLAA